MNFPSRLLSTHSVLMLALPVLLMPSLLVAQSTNRQIGTQFTVTADPVVSRPHTKPCVVNLFTGYQFAFFSNSVQTFNFTPPSDCAGPWEKVVLEANFSENAGVQFDRTSSLFIGNTNVYFGTTPEPLAGATNTWHVERDVTDYSALLKVPQQGTIVLANCTTDCPPPYNTFLNGIFTVNADLEFYPAQRDHDDLNDREGPDVPDAVLPLTQSNGQGGFNLPATISGTTQLSTSFTLPMNIERLYLDVVSQSQSGDEFWYTCVPNDVASELQSCGNTAFRETEITVDGTPAGVAPVSPWIYTGGIDPFLWFANPGIQTLDFVPYRVDLTPFAGLLNDGNPHTVGMSIFNNSNGYFSVTGSVLLFLDHGSSHVRGALTKNTLASTPSPVVTENINSGSTITGTVKVSSNRSYAVSGYVETSHGRVTTTIGQNIHFANDQNFDITSSEYVQDINQATDVSSKTAVAGAGRVTAVYTRDFHFPLKVDITENFLANGNVDQITTADQTYQVQNFGFGDRGASASFVSNSGQHQDTLEFDSSFNLLGNSNQSASQHYVSADSTGAFYDCKIGATSNALTSVSRGCNQH